MANFTIRQNGKKTRYERAESGKWFVALEDAGLRYCGKIVISRTSFGRELKNLHFVEFFDGALEMQQWELDLACDVIVAQRKISGDWEIPLLDENGKCVRYVSGDYLGD